MKSHSPLQRLEDRCFDVAVFIMVGSTMFGTPRVRTRTKKRREAYDTTSYEDESFLRAMKTQVNWLMGGLADFWLLRRPLNQMILPKWTGRVRIPHSIYLPLYATQFRIDTYQWSHDSEEAGRLHACRAHGRNGRIDISRFRSYSKIRALLYRYVPVWEEK
jgi:hypothetical protein